MILVKTLVLNKNMKYIYILIYFLSINIYSQNNSEIHKYENFVVINILDDNNPLIILKTDTIFNTLSTSNFKLKRKLDSIINSFNLKNRNTSKIKRNTPLIKKIKKLDTVFIYFKHKKNEYKKLSGVQSPDFKSIDYIFKFSNEHEFRFMKAEYLNLGFDRELADNKIKRKRFLRKNKHKILTHKILNREVNQLRNIYFLIKEKPIYLIDCKETKKGKITLRQVTLFGDFFEIE